VVAIAVLLPDRQHPAFLWGLAAFLVFYLSLYAVRHLVLPKLPSGHPSSRSTVR